MKKLESEVLTYLQERGWDTLRPSDVAKSISIEAAELLEIFQWTSMSIEETKADEKVLSELKKRARGCVYLRTRHGRIAWLGHRGNCHGEIE